MVCFQGGTIITFVAIGRQPFGPGCFLAHLAGIGVHPLHDQHIRSAALPALVLRCGFTFVKHQLIFFSKGLDLAAERFTQQAIGGKQTPQKGLGLLKSVDGIVHSSSRFCGFHSAYTPNPPSTFSIKAW
jgi:hypothetical protein